MHFKDFSNTRQPQTVIDSHSLILLESACNFANQDELVVTSRWRLAQSSNRRIQAFLRSELSQELRHSLLAALAMGWRKITDIAAFLKEALKTSGDKSQKIAKARKKLKQKRKTLPTSKSKRKNAPSKATTKPLKSAARTAQKPKKTTPIQKVAAKTLSKKSLIRKPTQAARPLKPTQGASSRYLATLNGKRKQSETVIKASGQAKQALAAQTKAAAIRQHAHAH